MKDQNPAVLFYTSDFLTGTAFMTDEQVGIYIRLLCLQHQHDVIPKEHMINICKTHLIIMSKFITDEDGNFYNDRMKIEKEKRKKYCDSRKENRTKSKDNNNIDEESDVKKVLTFDTTHEKDMLTHMSSDMENENDNINIDKGGKGGKEKIPPTLEDVKNYIAEKKYNVDPDKFFNHYEAKGWKIGKTPMKKWTACVQTWRKNDPKEESKRNSDWYNSYDVYLKKCAEAFNLFLNSEEKLKNHQGLNPDTQVELTIKKSFANNWGKRRGWDETKRINPDEILNFDNIIIDSISDKRFKVWRNK